MTRLMVVALVATLVPGYAAAQDPPPASAPQPAPAPGTAVPAPPGTPPPPGAERLTTAVRAAAAARTQRTFDLVRPEGAFAVLQVGDFSAWGYASGLTALQQRDYERAVAQFDEVLARNDTRADGALYWKAFAQHRLARTQDAVATLETLRREHPQSRYQPDAKVLEAEIRRTSGRPLSIEELGATDDMKLLALNGLARTDPARAIPLLGDVLNGVNTLAVKRRAIYVLALSDDARAQQMLVGYVTGSANPDLQSEAIRYLTTRHRDGRISTADLRRIYESTRDASVRRAIIAAYRSSGDAETLVAVARVETDLGLKREIVQRLSEMAPTSTAAADYLEELLRR